jgi:hypothetical protein
MLNAILFSEGKLMRILQIISLGRKKIIIIIFITNFLFDKLKKYVKIVKMTIKDHDHSERKVIV